MGTGEGRKELLGAIDDKLSKDFSVVKLRVKVSEGKKIAWLYEHAQVMTSKNVNDVLHLEVKISAENLAKFSAAI